MKNFIREHMEIIVAVAFILALFAAIMSICNRVTIETDFDLFYQWCHALEEFTLKLSYI